MGKAKWLISGEELPGYGLGDSREGLEDVEVLLVQGDWSLIGHQLWTMESLKTILKFDTGGSSCKARKAKRRRTLPNVAEGW